MLIAKDLLGGDVPEELSFLFKVDGLKEKMTVFSHQFSDREKMFLEYWRKVRKSVAKIEAIPKTRRQELEALVGEFFEMDMLAPFDLNYFERNTIEFYTNKIYHVYQEA